MASILIVEDEPSMRMCLKDNLEFEDYEVEVADNGEDGLNKIRENLIHLADRDRKYHMGG